MRRACEAASTLIQHRSYKAHFFFYISLSIPNTTKITPQRHLHPAPIRFSGWLTNLKRLHRHDIVAQEGTICPWWRCRFSGLQLHGKTTGTSTLPICWWTPPDTLHSLTAFSCSLLERHGHTDVMRHKSRQHGKCGCIRTCAWVRMACSSGHGGGACRGGGVTEGFLRSDPVGLAVPVTFLAGAGA